MVSIKKGRILQIIDKTAHAQGAAAIKMTNIGYHSLSEVPLLFFFVIIRRINDMQVLVILLFELVEKTFSNLFGSKLRYV